MKSFKLPEKGYGWVAYQLEKAAPDTTKKAAPDSSKKSRTPKGDAPDDKPKETKEER